MTFLVIGRYFKYSSPKLLFGIFRKDRAIKFNRSVWNVSCLGCTYHTTPLYYKGTESVYQRKMKERKLKILSKPISIWKNMTVTELAIALKEPITSIINALTEIGHKSNNADTVINEYEIIKKVVSNFGQSFKDLSNQKKSNSSAYKNCQLQDFLKCYPPDPSILVKRHPIVTIMGHVDHGKTTLLDSLRMSSIADTEFGGITQHIGAFNVITSNGEKITFLDTPGHAAFYAMRERGANVTDIVVLVVAADDGVMEQTIQSINMANEANVPIIVAINKIDKPNLDTEKIKKKLSDYGVIVEDMGGDCQCVNISAKKRTNLDALLEAISAEAEMIDLKGDPTGPVEAVIIEATNSVGQGKITTLIVQRGRLKKGDILVCGLTLAKVRSMFDHTGSNVSEAKLSDVVQITGWRDLPIVGYKVYQVDSEKKANLAIKHYQTNINQQKSLAQKNNANMKLVDHVVEHKKVMMMRLSGTKKNRVPLEKEKEDETLRFNIIIKGDVVGSVEAILDALATYNDTKCGLSIVNYGIGAITENDLELAKTFNAVIYCFNTEIPKSLANQITEKNIIVSQHNIIYRLIDDMKRRMTEILPIADIPETIGEGVVLQEFEIDNKKTKSIVAGCQCTKGVFKKNSFYKILRGNDVIYDGTISKMKHFKNDVETLNVKQEGGLMLTETVKLLNGDKIICYNIVKVPQSITWDPGF